MQIKKVGIIGGGQLAWMMGSAARNLQLDLVIQTPYPEDPAVAVATKVVYGNVGDAIATSSLAELCDVIGFENEFVDLPALNLLAAQGILFRPSLTSLEPLLDKYHQRCYLQKLGLPNPRFWLLESTVNLDDSNNLDTNNNSLQYPFVLKARRHGYDGQGTMIIKDRSQLLAMAEKIKNTAFLAEEFIPFTKELAVIAARSVTGEIKIYPIVETQQEEQVCRRVFAPAAISKDLVLRAEKIITTILADLEVVGLFAVELFLTSEGELLVNEIAPRTHNSGHLTLDACATSQFEQYLRAIAGQELGDASLQTAGAVMVNLLGYPGLDDYIAKNHQLSQILHSHVYWYNKTPRPGRKLGHVTVLIPTGTSKETQEEMKAIAHQIETIWYSRK
jgi:5-(carboxyamino)imidazole ribonucleotide synthase